MWWWALPAALLVGAAVWGVSAWLLQDLRTVPVAEQVSARIEAVRTALAAGAGVGAAVTLLLAVRRQRHQELATAHTTHDATERRVTELYTKAAEQLGNDQAPVRLAGLYALERLAQDTPGAAPDHCGRDLRVPPHAVAVPAEPDRHEKIRAAQRAARALGPSRSGTDGGRDPQEERQVRLTAQRILIAHLRHDDSPAPHRPWLSRPLDRNPRHWPAIRLDLAGAVLIDFDLSRCRMGTVLVRRATFTGDAYCYRAAFTGYVDFREATFTGNAWFGEVTFTGPADFREAAFTRYADFRDTTFTGHARFDEAVFTGPADFHGAAFTGGAGFDGATGLDDADLREVRVAPAAAEVEWQWPPAWREAPGADGWRTLRLTAKPPAGP
ncbi:pentapeptide repeat-containing protein [Nonomuraea sp. LPB2021202275-12-8]|uniref:pentapeptide repeat-containing protein n=1 Tax=Nonomuraea sp. LPB2021202275-12-8 TaxID=3120159 RepID=UPI00300D36E1